MTDSSEDIQAAIGDITNMKEPTGGNTTWDLVLRALTHYRDSRWRPIEEAPRDGTVVLVINGEKGGYGGEEGKSSTPYNIGTAYFDYREKWMANDCCDGVSTYKPTHWQPLPAPPTGESHE